MSTKPGSSVSEITSPCSVTCRYQESVSSTVRLTRGSRSSRRRRAPVARMLVSTVPSSQRYQTAPVLGAPSRALAAISLDVDGRPGPGIGERTPWLGELQRRHGFLRPTMFHSPYEAAAAFVIGHRISIVQTRRIRARMAEELGETIEVAGERFAAFPDPETLLGVRHVDGAADAKGERLHGGAGAAL